MQQARLGWSDDPEAIEQKALEYANKAIALDETLPFAHGVLAGIYVWQGRHDEAIAEGERWIELDPNEADAHVNLGGTLVFAGRPEDALPLIEKSMRLNPHYSFITLFSLGHAYFLMRRYADAADAFERGLKRNANFFPLAAFVASAYGHLGNADKARAAIERCMSQFGQILNAMPGGATYKRTEDNEHFLEGLRKAGDGPAARLALVWGLGRAPEQRRPQRRRRGNNHDRHRYSHRRRVCCRGGDWHACRPHRHRPAVGICCSSSSALRSPSFAPP